MEQYKGTIVESSLADKSILDQMKIVRKYQSEDWTLYDVWVDETQISELSRALADGPWYLHFWKPGEDEIRVVFKDKTFTVSARDISTWVNVIAYGKSIGIPERQLDFPID